MSHDYLSIADQRLTELYDEAAARRAVPPQARRRFHLRDVVGRALVRWGERLVGPAAAPIAHR